MTLRALAIAAVVAMSLAVSPCRAGQTLDALKSTHAFACGVVTDVNDESVDDTHGDLSAFESDFCRAVGAAVVGDARDVTLRAFPSEALGYQALQQGRIALLVGGTPNAGIARRYGLEYLTPVLFDAQAIMVHKDRGIASLKDLAGKQVCFIGNTDAEVQLHAAMDRQRVKPGLFPFQEIGEMEAALVGGRCDAETHDLSKLAAGRAAFHGRRGDFVILADRLSLDPLAPAVRAGDADWGRVVDWVFYALVQAEISGVTRANIDSMRGNADPAIGTLAGTRRGVNWGLYLGDDWAWRAIKTVGNYGEMFERDVGAGSPLRLDRGPNRPWTQGGMLSGAPFR